jgi:hypothetical protein
VALFGCLHAALGQALGIKKEPSARPRRPESAIPGQPSWTDAAVYMANGVLVRD